MSLSYQAYSWALYYALVLIVVAAISLISWILVLQYLRIQLAHIPSNLPWVGLRNARLFPKLRANLRELSVKRTVIEEGYEKYSKHDKPFILPTLHWPVVVLPPSQTRWLASQPDNILSTVTVQDDLVGVEYFAHGPDSAACHDFSIITRDLTRNIGRLTPLLLEEVSQSSRRELDSEDWREVEPASVMMKVAGEAVSRAIVGREIACQKEYHTRLLAWEHGFGYCALVFGQLCPRWLKPFAGRLLSVPLSVLRWRFGRLVLPEIKARIQDSRRSDGQKRGSAQNDLMQWVIESAERDPNPRARDLGNLLGRIMLYNMFAQHTTQNTAAAVLFDLLSYPSGQNVQPKLIQEAKAAMAKISDDPYATREMIKLDSAIRESMRLNPMSAKGFTKEVVKPGGVTTPNGVFLPQGCHVSSASISCVMRDSEFYENGDEFEPLRFCRDEDKDMKRQGASQVSDYFLAFSLGKHACPGRFFAVHLLKLMLGHILTNYEFQPLAERPDFVTFGDLATPPSTKVKVRRRSPKQ